MMNMLLFVLYWAGVWDGSTDGTKQFTQSNGIGQWQTNPWSNTLQFPDRTTAADNAALLDEVGNF